MKLRVAIAVALAWALPLGAGACNAILGNDSPTIGSDGGADATSTNGGDGSPSGADGSSLDGATTDTGATDGGGGGNDAPSTNEDGGSLPPCNGAVCFLAVHQPGPYEIAVDDTNAYFTNQGTAPALDGGSNDGGGSVMRVNLDGGSLTALSLGLHAPREILLDPSNVYWLSHDTPDEDGGAPQGPGYGAGSVGMVAKTGGAASFPVVSIPDDLLGLAMYEGNLVWGQPVSGIVGENLWDAGGPIHMNSGVFDLAGLVADATGVYQMASAGGAQGEPDIVQSITIGGAGQDTRDTQLYDYTSGPFYFGRAAIGTYLGKEYLYFLDTSDGWVVQFDLSFNQPNVIAIGQTSAVDIAYDPSTGHVYWTLEGTMGAGYSDGAVMTLLGAPDAGTPQLVASGQPRPHGIAVDATRVYWTNLVDGSVRFAPKP